MNIKTAIKQMEISMHSDDADIFSVSHSDNNNRAPDEMIVKSTAASLSKNSMYTFTYLSTQ